MDNFPKEIKELIFSYLDNISMWNAMQVSKSWESIFAYSTRLLTTFEFVIEESILKIIDLKNLPKVPIKNIIISEFTNITQDDPKKIFNIIKYFQDSVETLKFNFRFNPLAHVFQEFLKYNTLPEMPKLTFASFIDFSCFSAFHYNKSIEKVYVDSLSLSTENFDCLAKGLPNLKEIVILIDENGTYFQESSFPYKIKIFETLNLPVDPPYVNPGMKFLNSQKGYLKELKIHSLPNDEKGGDVLKFIIEDMNMEKFHIGNIPLILNGQKQQVYEITANGTQLSSIFVLFNQFPSIKKLTLKLDETYIDKNFIHSHLSFKDSIFRHIVELEIIDASWNNLLLKDFVEFYKMLPDIRKLSIETIDPSLHQVVDECLPRMKDLKEIVLFTRVMNPEDIFTSIKMFGPNVKKLGLVDCFANMAKIFFENDEIEIYILE